MHTRGSVLTKAPGAYETIDTELDEPRPNELLVRMAASGRHRRGRRPGPVAHRRAGLLR